MKKGISCILIMVLIMGTVFLPVTAAYDAAAYPYKREDIVVRDPFVLVYEGKYYLYGTGLKNSGYGCSVSEDLEHWSAATQVFTPPQGFDGVGCWWAPECHYYNGSFYMFATYLSASSGKRGTAIFKAGSPLGPFELWSDGHATPKWRDCIDGTLYVDDDGQPWMVYVGEWTSNEDHIGDMCIAKLSDDLSAIISEPVTVFRGTDAKWAQGKITDGPFVYRTKTGKLLMLWSNSSKNGYAVGLAYSVNGRIDGQWKQRRIPMYDKNYFRPFDGGHGMLFHDPDGNLLMAIHSPNYRDESVHETAAFLPVTDMGNTLRVTDYSEAYQKAVSISAAVRIRLILAVQRIAEIFRK